MINANVKIKVISAERGKINTSIVFLNNIISYEEDMGIITTYDTIGGREKAYRGVSELNIDDQLVFDKGAPTLLKEDNRVEFATLKAELLKNEILKDEGYSYEGYPEKIELNIAEINKKLLPISKHSLVRYTVTFLK